MRHGLQVLWLLSLGYSASARSFETLQHLGANSPWFAGIYFSSPSIPLWDIYSCLARTGPNVNKISPEVPDKCTVDQAVYVSRHGSRYPDPGAYAEWQALHDAVGVSVFIVFYFPLSCVRG